MSTVSRPVQRLLQAAGLLLSAGVIAACGGGGSSQPVASASSLAERATAYAAGPITGFGSIIVNGVRYDDSAASITDDDGTAHGPERLKLGMMVEVDAKSVDRAAGAGKALKVRFGAEITGPAEAAPVADGSLTILGQRIQVTASTVVDDGLAGGLAAVTAGTVLEVYGLPDGATGAILATRIEAKPQATAYRLGGAVNSLDAAAKTFRLGTLVVDYSQMPAASVPPALADKVRVRVQLKTQAGVDGRWYATAVRVGLSQLEERPVADIRGSVTVFRSTADFEVNGVRVEAAQASFPDGTAGLVLGARVEVEGAIANGVLVATKVELDDRRPEKSRVELHGALGALDTVAKTFILRGVSVGFAGVVTWSGGTALDLANGRKVEVKGTLAADRKSLQASEIQFEK